MSTTPQYLTSEYSKTNAAILKRYLDLDENPSKADYFIAYAIWDKMAEFSAGLPKHKLVNDYSDVFGVPHMQYLFAKSKETGKLYLPQYFFPGDGGISLLYKNILATISTLEKKHLQSVILLVKEEDNLIEFSSTSDVVLIEREIVRYKENQRGFYIEAEI